ncbi:helix-turn-helix domain-containing protein [Chloroflexota bacterium]
MSTTPTDDLLERLKDTEYAKLYGEENAKVDFAITLTKARKSLNLTQKSLADKLGISQPYVAKLEGGEANPTLGRIGSLLAAIHLRLVTGTAPLKPEPMPAITGFIPMGAADAVNAGLYLRTRHSQEESSWAFDFPSSVPVNAGTATYPTPVEPRRYSAREAVGGAAI